MKTRYSSLVSVKKNIMQKSERELQHANEALKNAINTLEIAVASLNDIETPHSGNIANFLSARALLDSQRALIQQYQEWVVFAQREVQSAQEQFKIDTIEYEKFNYLELQEIKQILHERKVQEAKDLDEVALMTYEKKRVFGVAS